MAFISKVGNLLRQSVSKHINPELYASNPSIFQAIRCMSSSKLFIGGLSYATDDTSLREAFTAHGEVIEAKVIMDRETGRSRGFGFITFTSGEEASSAIQAMDGQDLHGRRVRVNYATERAGGLRSGGGFGGGGGFSGGGSYGGPGGGGGGDSYGSGGGGSYISGGYDGRSSYDGGSGGGYGDSRSGNFNVAGGGGNDNYVSGGAGGNSGISYGGSSRYTSNQAGGITGSAGYGLDDPGNPLEGNFKDYDDEPSDFADKRS